jgi:hypothetical protein
MWNEVEREKKMAQHLFYVSMKYTKTCDVILNLIDRWERLIDLGIEMLLRQAKKAKKIKEIPVAPKARELAVRALYKDDMATQIMSLYSFFRKLPQLERVREHEFRKNVALRVIEDGREIVINMDKLKEWDELFCGTFLNYVRHATGQKSVGILERFR